MWSMGKRKKQKRRDEAALRFSGGRYERGGFPLDAIDELEKYQRLIIEAAKKVWRDQNPDKQRLPKKFNDRVRLLLTSVEPGSVLPVLEREHTIIAKMPSDLLALSIGYVDEAFALIAEKQALPDDYPESMIPLTRMFGGSLSPKEKITFRYGSKRPVKYTQELRKAFLESQRVIDRAGSGALIGTVRMLDAAQEFIFIDAEDRAISGFFSEKSIFDDLHEVHGMRDTADLVWITCDFIFDEQREQVVRITDVAAAGTFAHSSDVWAAPLAELTLFADGWLDGEGSRVELTALLGALDLLDAITEAELEGPSIFPDLNGGVRLEWLTDDAHTTLTIDDQPHFSGYHLNVENGNEISFDDVAGRDAALAFLRGALVG
jgi:hypothetical protein